MTKGGAAARTAAGLRAVQPHLVHQRGRVVEMLLRALAAGHGARLADGVQLGVGDERVSNDPRSILRLQAVGNTVRCSSGTQVTRDALVKVPAISWSAAGAIVEESVGGELAVALADSTDGECHADSPGSWDPEAVGIRRVNSEGVQEVGGALGRGERHEADTASVAIVCVGARRAGDGARERVPGKLGARLRGGIAPKLSDDSARGVVDASRGAVGAERVQLRLCVAVVGNPVGVI
mmetsp:Transcript_41950/g.100973  ORF Transcript_41950/g.100973 Transcript_41950/m.100973 type:complete len:237 (-) Transcript_41950:222-932(-)